MARLMANRHPITGFPSVDARLYDSIKVGDPYDPDMDGMIGSYGNVTNSVNRTRAMAGGMRQQFANLMSRMGTGAGAWGSPMAWNPANPNYGTLGAGTTTPAGGTNQSNLFDLINVSKDPSGKFDTTNRALLDKALATNPDYSSVRNSAQNALNIFDRQEGDLNALRGESQTLIDKFKALQPTLESQTLNQTNALGRVYLGANDPGSLAAELARNTEFARTAEKNVSDRAIRQAMFQNRLGSAGGAGSSYANAQVGDAVGRIASETAARDADRRRQDTSALLSAQERNLGRTQALGTADLARYQIPVDTMNRVLDTEARSALNRLAATGQAVTIDQLTDQLSTVGRQMGLTTQALQNYLAGHFQGIQKQGDDYPLYITGGGSRGRVNPYYADPGYGDGSGDGGDGSFIGGGMGTNSEYGGWVSDGKGGRIFRQSEKLKMLRRSQGWQRDANGNYTIPGNRALYSSNANPRGGGGYTDSYGFPGQYEMIGDFDYSQPGPLNYPGYNQGINDALSDYYESGDPSVVNLPDDFYENY